MCEDKYWIVENLGRNELGNKKQDLFLQEISTIKE
jgi:hypothetical protein